MRRVTKKHPPITHSYTDVPSAKDVPRETRNYKRTTITMVSLKHLAYKTKSALDTYHHGGHLTSNLAKLVKTNPPKNPQIWQQVESLL
jgi:hypothetical protein